MVLGDGPGAGTVGLRADVRGDPDPKWRLAADATFLSLLQAPDSSAPFSSRVDTKGRLWFEEYPRYPVADSEMVLNGHIFAMYGLHDYWQLTQDDNARKLFLGACRRSSGRS